MVNQSRLDALVQVLKERGFEKSRKDYKETWAPVDEEIRHVCEVRCVGHRAFAVVYPKVVIVDGAYRAGLSRCLWDSQDKGFDAHKQVATWMSSPEGSKIMSKAIKRVKPIGNTAEQLTECLRGHSSVVAELQKLGDSSRWPASFVSKYLHFHNSGYVIYDSEADARLTALIAEGGPFTKAMADIARPENPSTYSEAYYQYLCRFQYLLEAARRIRPKTSVKEADHFLWNA